MQMLASAANLRDGQAIVKSREYKIIKNTRQLFSVRTLLDTPRTVELTPGPLGLIYKCTCSAQLAKPCKHVVAATILAWRRFKRTGLQKKPKNIA
jgi:uncharacterized Zn finger protein